MNRLFAVICGAAAAIAAAIVWGAITAATNFQIGYMAIGVGFAVAFAVRAFAGRDRTMAYVSAALSLCGCVLGNYLAMTTLLAQHQNASPVDAALRLLPSIFDVLQKTFSPMDLVFYAIGVHFGYKYALRPSAPTAAAAAAPSTDV
jgi:hypothetical protein